MSTYVCDCKILELHFEISNLIYSFRMIFLGTDTTKKDPKHIWKTFFEHNREIACGDIKLQNEHDTTNN